MKNLARPGNQSNQIAKSERYSPARGKEKEAMAEVEETARKISPGTDRGLLKRVQFETGIRYETLISWRTRGLQRSSYPVRLLWAILDVLADDGTFSKVMKRAKGKIHGKQDL